MCIRDRVKGRNKMTWRERFRYDIQYVENISFLLDLKIILSTVINVLTKKNVADAGEVKTDKFGDYLLYNGYRYRSFDKEREYERYLREHGLNMSDYEIREISYSLLIPYEDELKKMFTLNTYAFHYPDKEVDVGFIDENFKKLYSYLEENNTYFIAAFDEDKIEMCIRDRKFEYPIL